MGPLKTRSVEDIKALRVEADALIQKIQDRSKETSETGDSFNYEVYGMAEYQALRAATEAKMWLGKMLEGIGNPFPKELADKAETAR